jgi:peptidoglycan/LPS O-acetylase OafA/YrhL
MFWASIPLFYLQNLITGGPTADVAQIVSAATFTHWVKPQWNNSAVPGSWSIACEVTFYLFFPFVAARVTNVRQGIGLVAIAVVLAVFCGPF